MVEKCLQTDPRVLGKETKDRQPHDSKNTDKVKQPALFFEVSLTDHL